MIPNCRYSTNQRILLALSAGRWGTVTPAVLTVVSGVSGFLGAVSLVGYLYFYMQALALRRSERSVKEIVEGEGLFNSAQVIHILRQFKTEDAKLEALRALLGHDDKTGRRTTILYSKIKEGVDLHALEKTSSKSAETASKISAAVFVFMFGCLVVYQLIRDQVASPPPPPAQSLRIDNLRLFKEDFRVPEVTRAGKPVRSTLSKLVQREGVYYEVNSPADFMLALGFVIRGLRIHDRDKLNAEVTVIGLASDGRTAVWRPGIQLHHVDDWESLSIPKKVGADAVRDALSVKPGDGVPIAVVIECMDAKALRDWSGKIQIRVRDGDGPVQELPRPFNVELKKPTQMAEGNSCP
jgi:hypothetical protein